MMASLLINPHPGVMSDLYRFDTVGRSWTQLETKGASPSARNGLSMTSSNDWMIIFGGNTGSSQQALIAHIKQVNLLMFPAHCSVVRCFCFLWFFICIDNEVSAGLLTHCASE